MPLLRAECIRVAVYDIENALLILLHDWPQLPVFDSRHEIYRILALALEDVDLLIENGEMAALRQKICELAVACVFAIASIEQGEIKE